MLTILKTNRECVDANLLKQLLRNCNRSRPPTGILRTAVGVSTQPGGRTKSPAAVTQNWQSQNDFIHPRYFSNPLISFNFNKASTGVSLLISIPSNTFLISSKVSVCASNME